MLNDYQSLIDTPRIPIAIRLQAQLHRLSLLLDFQKWIKAKSNLGNTQLAGIQSQINQQIRPSIEQILKISSAFSELPANQSVYTKLNFANSLNQIPDEQLHSVALQYAESALQTAKATGEQRLMSNAYGILGKLDKQQVRSRTYLEQAMSLAQSIQAWDIAYQWQWELGRLYRLSRDFEKANQFYAAAIKNLDKTRSDILLINSDIQFAFKEKVESLYHEYISLLLHLGKSNKAYLKQAIELQEQLNFAEVENFLRCGRFLEASVNSNVRHTIEDLPAIIYLIKLADRVEVAVKTPQDIYRHTVDFNLVEQPLDNLFELVQNLDFIDTQSSNSLIYSQAVYQLLFEPIKQHLPQSGALGFVLDSYFQSLPLAMLYDGEQYLIDKYNISVSSSAKQLQQSLSQPTETLISGVSQISPSFYNPIVPKNLQPLPQVKIEIENIKKSNASTSTLVDAEFTSQSFKQINENNSFSVIHLSTHAQFSSDLEQTFVLAWDTPLNVKDLKFLVQKKSSLDLLVLSACQTAKGDRRSFLGIAGMAAQAGARGILASLWLVDAESTTQLMSKFYDGLKHGLTKAEALRLAQLSLLKSDKYFHPYYWAGFILVGG